MTSPSSGSSHEALMELRISEASSPVFTAMSMMFPAIAKRTAISNGLDASHRLASAFELGSQFLGWFRFCCRFASQYVHLRDSRQLPDPRIE